MATAADPDSRAFVDTNVLIYAFDHSEAAKHAVADALVESLLVAGRLVLSAQVLNEFYWASTRPHRKSPLDHETATQAVKSLARHARVVGLDASLTLAALDAVDRHGLSFWDALIWAAAKFAECAVVYSEDFQNGRELDGVRFHNPFE